jgi:enamine deaminase RidA (YjgF/YER057c/UK114 family)
MTNTEAKQQHQESLNKRPALLKQIKNTPEQIVEDEKWVSNPVAIILKSELRSLDRKISELGQVWNDKISRKSTFALKLSYV